VLDPVSFEAERVRDARNWRVEAVELRPRQGEPQRAVLAHERELGRARAQRDAQGAGQHRGMPAGERGVARESDLAARRVEARVPRGAAAARGSHCGFFTRSAHARCDASGTGPGAITTPRRVPVAGRVGEDLDFDEACTVHHLPPRPRWRTIQ
jgi:hypothetical protein